MKDLKITKQITNSFNAKKIKIHKRVANPDNFNICCQGHDLE